MSRPKKYSKKIANQIFELLRTDTYTVAEVCRIVRIAPSTFYSWRSIYPNFADELKQAEAERTAFLIVEAKKSLLKRVQGYTVQENHITTIGSGKYDANGKEIPRIKERKTVDRHFQPDTAAVIFTLCNGEPERWKNKQSNEVTGKDGKDLFGQLTDDQLNARIAELNRIAGECLS